MNYSQQNAFKDTFLSHKKVAAIDKMLPKMDFSEYTGARGFDSLSEDLRNLGLSFDKKTVGMLMRGAQMRAGAASGFGMDATQATITTPNIGTPVQFLQNILPGYTAVNTAVRQADEIAGILISGAWSDEQVVKALVEMVGYALPYGDYTNPNLASWNMNYNTRTVVRFEQGYLIGRLEEDRAARMLLDDSTLKRQSAMYSLDIVRNQVFFYGFNSGANQTYGFLNDPNLANYITVTTKAGGGTTWAVSTTNEIITDLLVSINQLTNVSGGNVDPRTMPCTLVLPTNCVNYLSQTTINQPSTGWTWLAENYPGIRVVSAPQLQAANGGANVFYLFCDNVSSANDYSTDGGQTWLQVVPTKLQLLGLEQNVKGYLEDYTNATAGAFLQRPWANVRYTGI